MAPHKLTAISPIDGRYQNKTIELQPIFSEFGLMKYRLLVEIRWLQTLANNNSIKELTKFNETTNKFLEKIITNFTEKDAERIKTIEKRTNHDIKAIEYFLKEKFQSNKQLANVAEFLHFACTSEDINNLAYSLMLKTALKTNTIPTLNNIINKLKKLAQKHANIPMLARTHGQPATPTTMGKEIANFAYRLAEQLQTLKQIKITGKCNGAVGNFNAHIVAYPNVNWEQLSKQFIKKLGLEYNPYTTQIEPHDYIAELSHALMRINTTLIDFSRDVWMYVSLNYFSQQMNKNEIGSSTMPHKINPIDFENAEGNFGLSNAMLQYFANKLPISRMQRDLSDSTVMRNLGSAFAYALIAYKSLLTGLDKLKINKTTIFTELNQHWEILAEPIQMVMRRYNIAKPYEKLKALTRGRNITQETLLQFVEALDIPKEEKNRLKKLTPNNYLGLAVKLAKEV